MRKKSKAKAWWAGVAFAAMLLLAVFLIYYVEASLPVFEASAATDLNESIKVTVTPSISKPSLWAAAWRVGSTQVSTVSLGITVQATGTNVANPKLTYYVKAANPSRTNSKIYLSGLQVPIYFGQNFGNSTGSMSIDSHLQDLGLSTSCDQTVDYLVYVQLQATGTISGQALTATIQETVFSTVTYDYGGLTSSLFTYTATADSYVCDQAPTTNYGTATNLYAGAYGSIGTCYTLLKFDITQPGTILAGYLYVNCYTYTGSGTVTAYRVTGDWTELGVTWNNKPSYDTSKSASVSISSTGYKCWTVTSLFPSTNTPQFISFCLIGPVNNIFGFYSRESTSNQPPKLMVSIQYIDWSMSIQWANQPLSLIAVPVARLLVSVSLIGFAGLIIVTQISKGRKALWALVLALILLVIGCHVGSASAAAQLAEIPEKWKAGDTALYITSFPFPVYETVGNVTLEVPQKVMGDLIVSLVVWNVSGADPIRIAIDGKDQDLLMGEGFYTCTYSLKPGSHSITIYNSLKIFEQSAFIVEEAPQPILIPISEFMEKLKAERETVIRNCVIAATAGVPVGFWVKRKTKIRTDWILPMPGLLLGIGFLKLPDLYMLLPFASTLILTYYLCPDFAKWLTLAQIKADALDLSVKLPVDKDHVILGISPRYWKQGFIHKKRLQVVDTLPDVLGTSLIKLNLEDKICDCIILDPEKGVSASEDSITIYGKPALRKALQDSGIVEKLAFELKTSKVEARVAKDLIEEMAVLGAIDLKKALQSPLRAMLESRLKSFTGLFVSQAHKTEQEGEKHGENQKEIK